MDMDMFYFWFHLTYFYILKILTGSQVCHPHWEWFWNRQRPKSPKIQNSWGSSWANSVRSKKPALRVSQKKCRGELPPKVDHSFLAQFFGRTFFFLPNQKLVINCTHVQQTANKNPVPQVKRRLSLERGHFVGVDGRVQIFHGLNVVQKSFPWHPEPRCLAWEDPKAPGNLWMVTASRVFHGVLHWGSYGRTPFLGVFSTTKLASSLAVSGHFDPFSSLNAEDRGVFSDAVAPVKFDAFRIWPISSLGALTPSGPEPSRSTRLESREQQLDPIQNF